MRVNRCSWDTRDKVTGLFACVNPNSPKFSCLKKYACSNMQIGCKLWEPYNPVSVICIDDELPYFAVKLLAKIF